MGFCCYRGKTLKSSYTIYHCRQTLSLVSILNHIRYFSNKNPEAKIGVDLQEYIIRHRMC